MNKTVIQWLDKPETLKKHISEFQRHIETRLSKYKKDDGENELVTRLTSMLAELIRLRSNIDGTDSPDALPELIAKYRNLYSTMNMLVGQLDGKGKGR